MSVEIGAALQELAGRDAGRGLDEVDALQAHYAELGVDVDELAAACLHYLRGRRRSDTTTAVVSLAGRMFEIGYRSGRNTGDIAKLVDAARDVIDHAEPGSDRGAWPVVRPADLRALEDAVTPIYPGPGS
jgi:hypothetical protein